MESFLDGTARLDARCVCRRSNGHAVANEINLGRLIRLTLSSFAGRYHLYCARSRVSGSGSDSGSDSVSDSVSGSVFDAATFFLRPAPVIIQLNSIVFELCRVSVDPGRFSTGLGRILRKHFGGCGVRARGREAPPNAIYRPLG